MAQQIELTQAGADTLRTTERLQLIAIALGGALLPFACMLLATQYESLVLPCTLIALLLIIGAVWLLNKVATRLLDEGWDEPDFLELCSRCGLL